MKLVAAFLLLLVGALLVSGIAARATMRSYLVSRVDDQLRSAAHRPGHGGGDQGGGAPRDGGGDPGRLPSEFVLEVTDAQGKTITGPTSNLIDNNQALPRLPSTSGAETRRHGERFLDVPAVQGDVQWRVLAEPVTLPDGTAGTTYLAQSLDDVDRTIDRLTLLLLVIGAGAVVLFAGVGYLLVRVSLRPLRRVETTAAAIAGGDLGQRVPELDPRTEIGQLSGALNTMLNEVESAFAARAASESAARDSEERMRRFVADASHELRTPLTSIRGFAELYRQTGGRPDADGQLDVGRMMRRIEDEAKRMGVLVEDLLLLARLDQQRPLAQVPVDVLDLARDAVDDARAVAPERPIRLDVGATDPPPIVIGDDARLRQVLGNLVANALQHTPAGTPVEVRVETRPPHVLLSVIDHGPGMDPEDAQRVFERFYRTDGSRTRADGGSGLGLAIVSALVAGHGGTVGVETAPGAGASFRVELPLADPERHG